MSISEIHITIDDAGEVGIEFSGEHVRKLVLMRIIKSLKLHHRKNISTFRRDQLKKAKEIKERKENAEATKRATEETRREPERAASEPAKSKGTGTNTAGKSVKTGDVRTEKPARKPEPFKAARAGGTKKAGIGKEGSNERTSVKRRY